ncbi:GA module-containing protein [Gardnerella vaginalis]|uniref:GA module n=1 Tax=Gardnerella vaginalis TaxID=2702 RepID=UPI00200EFB5F|nr:GA module [Gardnerella vaginalis]UQA81687.1 GA module-containing protein [Gardnerella vaginalis]
MSKKIRVVKHYSGVYSGINAAAGADSQPVLSKSVCAAMLAGAMVLGGGVFVSSPAYADGYVDGTGNNIYYGYKTDASYTEARFHIEVDYYDTLEHAQAGKDEGKDPLGKFVRVHYLSNCAKKDGTADDWRFRPMWWFGVPKGLQNVQNITYTRVEKLTNQRGNQPFVPAGSSQFTFTDTNGYGVVSKKTYPTPKQWKGISNFYFDEQNVLANKGWKQLLGLNGGSYDNAGNTEGQWGDYQKETDGLQGIFVDWESAGQRFYDMTYVGEMTKATWENRDVNPLRFAAGVYRFAGNWHYAVGQKHNTPKIADHLKLVYPEVTKVKKLDALTNDEKGKVKEAIENANRGKAGSPTLFDELVKDDQDGIVINNDGSATITFKDNTKRTMPASLLVSKDESDSDKYKPTLPERTPVVNLKKLTPDEKTKIRQAIIDANGKGTPNDFLKHVKQTNSQYDFKVNEDGSVEVTYEDDSKLTIPSTDLVFQGPKISDWAPYVVPDAIEVDNLQQISQEEITKIVNAFDTANTGITPYDEAKTNNSGNTPVSIDKTTGDATITWKDGSKTTIAAWQFLKQKPKAPAPEPQPPVPTPAAEKEFIVEAPQNQSSVDFDPFNAKESDLTDNKNKQALTAIEGVLKKCAAKDAKDNNTSVTIKAVEFKIVDGKGVVVFHADKYKDATYPMSVFLKQKANNQTPQTPSTETKTENGQNEHDTFKYKVTKTQINGDTPTAQDAVKALKQFVKDNYDNVSDSDLASVVDSVTAKATWTPKTGTRNMGAYDAKKPNDGPVTSFDIDTTNGYAIKVNGHPWADNDDGGDWDSAMEGTLFTIKPSDLYVKKGNTQQQKDNTIDNLKQQAKDLLDKRKNKDKLSNEDLKRAGIEDPDQLNDAKIDEMAKGQKAEKDLRDLIRKLTDAKKAERKYHAIAEVEVADPENLSEADFKKAAEAFLKANYDGTGSLAGDKAPYTVPTGLTPKTDTALMELASDTNATGISSITYANSDFNTLIFTDKNKKQLFTVSVKYKKKAETPAPTPDALAQMKKDAEQQIDRNPNLTKEQKEDYKKQIEQATTVDKIKEILDKAAQQGKANQNDPSKKQTITDNKGGSNAKQEKEKEQKEKDKKEREKKQEEQTTKDKKSANDTIDGLSDLTKDEKDKLKENLNGKSGDTTKPGAKTPEEVQQIVNEAQARNAARKAIKDELPFLSHGKGESDNDDKALKELIGSDPAKKDSTLTDLENALTAKDATAESINKALKAAKRQNAINEQNAKNAGIAKLDAKKAELDAAYNSLTEDQKKSAKEKYDAAIQAINNAESAVNQATKPSDIKTAVESVKDETINDANKAIEDAKGKRDTSGNTNDNADALTKEKEAQKKRIQDSDLPDADKQKAIDDINNAKKLGDPTAIADRALKAQKIADALKKIDEFKHLNDKQKEAFKKIIEDTDASNHKNADGSTSDDIDDALANAANTDNAMARLEELKVIADKFAKGDAYKNSNDANKKKAFDDASTAAGAVLDKAKGNPKDADQVNELYKDLLKAMQDLDNTVKGAGVKTDALAAEIDSDKNLKPSETDPKTPGDSVYNTSSKEKKEAFDKALKDAEAALQTANSDNEDAKKPTSTPLTPDQEAQKQKAVDEALDKLIKARLALDGVNTKPLQDEIDKDNKVKNSDKYTYSIKDKKTAFDTALSEANELIKKLTGAADQQAQPGQGTQQPDLSTKEAKQKALDAALKKLQDAAKALDGTKPIEPNPTPTPTPTPSPLPTPGAGTDNPGSGNAGSGSEAGYGVNDNAPTIVDKGELNIQIDSAETDSKPGNAGAGNAGNANAGSATGAQGGAGTSSGSGMGTGTAGAANAGVDNKAVNNAVENAPEVKQADAAVKQAAATLDEALAQAKRVAADPHATQAQVDAAAVKLADARKALADAQDNAAKVRAAVRSRVIKGMRSRGNAGVAAGADVATAGLMATMIAAIGGAFVTRRMRAMHANRD